MQPDHAAAAVALLATCPFADQQQREEFLAVTSANVLNLTTKGGPAPTPEQILLLRGLRERKQRLLAEAEAEPPLRDALNEILRMQKLAKQQADGTNTEPTKKTKRQPADRTVVSPDAAGVQKLSKRAAKRQKQKLDPAHGAAAEGQWGNGGRWIVQKKRFKVAMVAASADAPAMPVGDMICWEQLKSSRCSCAGGPKIHLPNHCSSHVAHMIGQRGACDRRKCAESLHLPREQFRKLCLESFPPEAVWTDGGVEEQQLPPSAVTANAPSGDQQQHAVEARRTGRSLDRLLERERARQPGEGNRYLAEFARATWIEPLLNDKRFHSIANWKEKVVQCCCCLC